MEKETRNAQIKNSLIKKRLQRNRNHIYRPETVIFELFDYHIIAEGNHRAGAGGDNRPCVAATRGGRGEHAATARTLSLLYRPPLGPHTHTHQ